MYSILIEVEEIKPGMMAFKATPKSDQNTTDSEQHAGDMINGGVGNLITAISQCSSQSELISGPSEGVDSLYETRKDDWQHSSEDGLNPSRS
jgi:hypothetical protein